MAYKALFLDVDGTVVVHGIDNLPSPRVTDAINRCKDKGVAVCLATSRTPKSTHKIIEHLKLTGYCVLSGGTQIYDPQKKKIIIEKLFPEKTLQTVVDVARECGNQDLRIYDGQKEMPYDSNRQPEKVLGVYFPKLEPSVLQVIYEQLQSLEGIALHRMNSWVSGFETLDVTSKDASKLHGITEVMKLLGIETHELIGVGDGYNDFPLLMACGLKIAMGNAVPELKAIADFVAPTVEEDGVATVIEKFILSK